MTWLGERNKERGTHRGGARKISLATHDAEKKEGAVLPCQSKERGRRLWVLHMVKECVKGMFAGRLWNVWLPRLLFAFLFVSDD